MPASSTSIPPHASFADWNRAAGDIAAMLRSEAGSNPHDKQLVGLIGVLSTRSEESRTRWAAHNVRFHRAGHKHAFRPSGTAAPGSEVSR
jgi:hypothetical protein